MINDQFQAGMFDKQALVLDLQDADLEYRDSFIESEQGWALYQQIIEQTELTPDPVTIYAKQYLTPRLTCWMGDDGLDYSYSNYTMKPIAWSPLLNQLRAQVEQAAAHSFNSVLINYYRDGQDSNGWHADDEPELGKNPVIASLSLGGERDFQLRHKTHKKLKHTISLKNGSLLLMRGSTQSYWQHQIPKRAIADGRINLTFRQIVC